MATTFTGLRVQDTYNAILKIGNNSNLSGTAKILSDGVGNSSSIYLSTTRLGIGITPAYQFHTSGNAKIGGNLIVSGNLTVNGTLTYLNVEDLAVEDPLIKLAKDNTANTLDIGFFGKYVATGTKYKGLFNDASDDKFKLFIGTGTEPTTTVDTTASGYAVGTLVANLEGNVTGTVSSLSNHDTNDLSEGSTNLYYTNARADARVNLQTGANLDLSSKDTDDLSEGTTNLYFTTTRARASFTDGTGVTITDGEIAIGQAVATDSNVNFNRITSSEDIRFDGTNTRLRSDSEFDFLTISGQAQSLRTKGVSAQTTYSGNSASSGMFNALNGYAVGTGSGTTVIDSSRNLTNIGTATFAGSVTGTQAIFSSSTAPVIQSTSSSTAENMLLVGTDTTAASAPDLVLYRNAGATADNDTLGVVEFRGRNDANTGVKSYSGIYSRIIDASENKGALTFSANSGSNYVNVLAIHNTGTNQPKVIIGNTDPFAVPTHTLDVDGTLHVSGSISGTTGTFSGNISALGGSFTDPVTIYDSTISENPRLSLGRQAAESLQFDVTDRVAVIRHKNDSDSNQVHSLDFTIDTPSTGDKTFNFGVAGNTTSTYLTISNTGATFTGLVTGIAPTSDLNFATKKYVDDNIVPAQSLSNVLGVGNTSGANDIIMADDQKINFGTDSDLFIVHNDTNGVIENIKGNLVIQNKADDSDIIFKSDNGSGGIIEYFRLDGSTNTIPFGRSPHLPDGLRLYFGNDTTNDASIRWDSTASQLFISGESKFLDDLYVVGDIIGNLTGNVSGNVTGNVTGNLTGDVTGDLTGNVTGLASLNTPLNDIRSLGVQYFTNGTNPNITTAQVMAEIESDGGFDSYSSVFKTAWSYAGNYNLTDAGRFTETAGSSWITWTDNSSDTTRGNITALAIAPTTGGSAGKVFIYNDQGSSYSPGWREVWTSTSDGSGSGLDADLLDGQQGSYYAPATGGSYVAKAGDTMTGDLKLNNSVQLKLGTSSNTSIYNDGTDTYIQQTSGNLYLWQSADDKDIIFASDNGSGGVVEYFRVDGGDSRVIFGRSIQMADNVSVYFGNSVADDGYIKWDSTANQLFINGNAKFLNNLYVTGNQYFNGTVVFGDGKNMLRYNDAWLRINEDNDFTSGIYCGTGILRTDGEFQVGGNGGQFKVESNGNTTINGVLTANAGSTSTHILTNTTSNGTVLQLNSTGDSRTLTLQTDHIYSNGTFYLGDNSYQTNFRGSSYDFANGAVTINSNLYVGTGTSSNIFMGDSDNGVRRIHCNSNKIGFLNDSNGWGAYCADNGDWTTDFISYAGASMRAPIFYDYQNTAYYGDFSNTTYSLNTAGSLKIIGAVGSDGDSPSTQNQAVRVSMPNGASRSWDSAQTGAIKIRLPKRANNTMWSMKVRIYNYAINQASEYTIGNYSYSAGGYNSSASFQGAENMVGRRVRWGNDGTYDCVWIGETDSSWSYPVVSVMDFNGGFRNGTAANWTNNWDISLVTSFDTVATAYYPSTQVGNIGYATASFRAPIFYDSNDTAYYGDFGGSSRINQIYGNYLGLGIAANTSGSYRINMGGSIDMNANSVDYVSQLHFNDNVRFYDDGNDSYLNFKYGDASTGGIKFYNGSTTLKGYVYANSSGFGLLDNDGQWAVRTQTGDLPLELRCNNNVEFEVHPTFTKSLGQSRAPIFYDSNDTNYYVDPATGSNLKGIVTNTSSSNVGSQLKIYTTTNHQYPQIHSNAALEAMWNYKNNNAEWYVGIRTSSQLLGTEGFHFYNTTSGQTVGGWSIDGHSYSIGSSRAPIFYDSNNTGYYVDPYSTSNVVTIRSEALGTNTSGSQTNQNGLSLYGAYSGGLPTYGMLFSGTAGLGTYGGVTGTWATYFTMNTSSGRGWIFRDVNGSGNVASINNDGWAQFEASVRTPIFYDSNNTGFYVDPASTSRLLNLDFGDSGYYIKAGDWGPRIQSPAGWIQFGPANTSHAHIYTDRPNFYFNKMIQVLGSSQMNQYDIRSKIFYDIDNTGYYVDPASTSVLYNIDVRNAATIKSNSSSRVLYLKQNLTNAGNIIQFQDQSANNTWELVGRNNGFYLYNNMNSVGYVMRSRADNGYVAILKGGTDAGYHLDVGGTIRATSDVIAFSDRRVKENIVTIDNALEKVTKLRGVSYTRKDIEDKSTKVGVIAQEVLEVLPEVVTKDNDDKYSVAYGNMAGVFIEAIKELKTEIDNLKQEIKTLKNN